MKDIIKRIEDMSADFKVTPRYSNQLELIVPAEKNVSALSFLKQMGFAHLSNITCIDRISSGRFEVVYNVWSYTHKIHCTVKASVDREKPVIDTVLELWPQAQVYEQDVHEFFGVVFEGNPDLSSLFLHNWLDIPPMRKDFDSEEYSRRAYGFIDEDQKGGNE